MAKKAVLIGCNYPGTNSELKGCVNDVTRMHSCLIDRYGFLVEDVAVLIDTDESYTQPTGANIRAALANLVGGAQPGDILFVHYSGHGTRLPAETGEDDDTGYDECIVPTDMNLINDDDFRALVDAIPEGCQITIVSDSCHSGGLIDEAEEQIGESFIESGERTEVLEVGETNGRTLPLSSLVEILQERTGDADIQVGKLRPTLFDMFGQDSSPKIKKFVNVMVSNLQGGAGNGGLAQQFLQQKLETDADYASAALETCVDGSERMFAGAVGGRLPDGGILISGCQTDQTSSDVNPTGDPSGAYGALSNAILGVVSESDGQVSNRELVMKVREVLMAQGFAQRPGLYCGDAYADAPFIC